MHSERSDNTATFYDGEENPLGGFEENVSRNAREISVPLQKTMPIDSWEDTSSWNSSTPLAEFDRPAKNEGVTCVFEEKIDRIIAQIIAQDRLDAIKDKYFRASSNEIRKKKTLKVLQRIKPIKEITVVQEWVNFLENLESDLYDQ